jgi:integrase
VVYCLAKLGLRAGEVAHLSLEDLDWRQGTLRLTQTKGRHERLLPLLPTVGKAVAHYLRWARPTIPLQTSASVALSPMPVSLIYK